jgi:hypothetical protein
MDDGDFDDDDFDDDDDDGGGDGEASSSSSSGGQSKRQHHKQKKQEEAVAAAGRRVKEARLRQKQQQQLEQESRDVNWVTSDLPDGGDAVKAEIYRLATDKANEVILCVNGEGAWVVLTVLEVRRGGYLFTRYNLYFLFFALTPLV